MIKVVSHRSRVSRSLHWLFSFRPSNVVTERRTVRGHLLDIILVEKMTANGRLLEDGDDAEEVHGERRPVRVGHSITVKTSVVLRVPPTRTCDDREPVRIGNLTARHIGNLTTRRISNLTTRWTSALFQSSEGR